MSKDDAKIAKLEQAQIDMKEDLTKIISVVEHLRDNHLHTIEGKLNDLDKKVTYLIGGGTAIIGAIELLAKFVK